MSSLLTDIRPCSLPFNFSHNPSLCEHALSECILFLYTFSVCLVCTVHVRTSSMYCSMWCCMSFQSLSNFSSASSPLLSSLVSFGQALERQKEYFDCIRNERDELRDELADIKGKSKAGEVGLPKSRRKIKVRGMSCFDTPLMGSH